MVTIRTFDPDLSDLFFTFGNRTKASDETTGEAWARAHDQNSKFKTEKFLDVHEYQEAIQTLTSFLILLLHLR